MLDVLELDAVRAPDEHGEGVRGVDDVGDLDSQLLCGRSGVDEHPEVVEERSLRLARVSLDELEVGAPDLDAVRVVRSARSRTSATPAAAAAGSGE